jgi:hypothetical protein
MLAIFQAPARKPQRLEEWDLDRLVGIHVPTQWGRISRERRDAHALGTVDGVSYYRLADHEPGAKRYVRLRALPNVELQNPRFIAYRDLPQSLRGTARRLARSA